MSPSPARVPALVAVVALAAAACSTGATIALDAAVTSTPLATPTSVATVTPEPTPIPEATATTEPAPTPTPRPSPTPSPPQSPPGSVPGGSARLLPQDGDLDGFVVDRELEPSELEDFALPLPPDCPEFEVFLASGNVPGFTVEFRDVDRNVTVQATTYDYDDDQDADVLMAVAGDLARLCPSFTFEDLAVEVVEVEAAASDGPSAAFRVVVGGESTDVTFYRVGATVVEIAVSAPPEFADDVQVDVTAAVVERIARVTGLGRSADPAEHPLAPGLPGADEVGPEWEQVDLERGLGEGDGNDGEDELGPCGAPEPWMLDGLEATFELDDNDLTVGIGYIDDAAADQWFGSFLTVVECPEWDLGGGEISAQQVESGAVVGADRFLATVVEVREEGSVAGSFTLVLARRDEVVVMVLALEDAGPDVVDLGALIELAERTLLRLV